MRGHNYDHNKGDVCKKCGKVHIHHLSGKVGSLKGKTYEELYGKEEAERRRKKKREYMLSNNPMKKSVTKKKHKSSVQKKYRLNWRSYHSESLSGRRVGGALKPKQVAEKIRSQWKNPNSTYNTPLYHSKLSLSQRNSWKEGRRTYNKSFGRTSHKNIRGEKFQSSLELKLAEYFYSNRISYEQYPLVESNNKRCVLDFYLPSKELLVEVVGMFGYNLWGYDEHHERRMKILNSSERKYIMFYTEDFKNLQKVFEDLDKKVYVSEIFGSILGEGNEIGQIASFVRFSKCNLRCIGCDTAYSFEEGKLLSLREILDLLKLFKLRRVFVTGGEPCISSYIKDFLVMLKLHKYEVIIQTNGTVFDEEIFDMCDFISCDVKTPVFGTRSVDRVITQIYENYSRKHQFKFVVKNKEDIKFVENEIARLKIPQSSQIILQPFESKISENSLEYVENIKESLQFLWEYVTNSRFWVERKVRVLPQLHKLVYGTKRGV